MSKKIHIGSMSREQAIGILNKLMVAMKTYDGVSPTQERINALQMAIDSLEADEAYQLEYERTTKNDCETCIHNKGVLECDMYGCKYEPTTKNNLGVDAVSRQAINGYIDYILSHGMGKKKSFDFIKKFVANLPPVTPQEPILDKIRAEIEQLQKMCDKNDLNLMAQYSAFGMTLEVIDKYKYYDFCPNCGSDNREVEE